MHPHGAAQSFRHRANLKWLGSHLVDASEILNIFG